MSTRRRFNPRDMQAGKPPSFRVVIDRPTMARHVFSVCLYHEPEFAVRFPSRVFEQRYLDHLPEVRALFVERGFHLRIFVDQASLSTAMSLGFGSVYLVDEPPPFPFSQHLWRYYSALIPHPTIEAHHFRGLDNLLVSPSEIATLEHFLASGADILHAPYMRARGRVFMPIRGSCSIARGGIQTLAQHLCVRRQTSFGPWPEDWHCDERWLAVWFDEVRSHSGLYTVVDRELPAIFYEQLAEQLKHERPAFLLRTPGRGMMSSAL